ncbi:MAG TPA: aldolase [Sphingomonadaceae bacterium]|jgi:serine kinase of HPr protein (carbohydrate metabolism regulator)|nr:aldolase [Sphingomonadaceae bacterium]
MSMADPQSETVHATAVAIDAAGEVRAVLLQGRPGAGKSDLALRLIDRGARLVSDDYTMLRRSGDRLLASAPATIAGRIEVRGIGILAFPALAEAPVALTILLDKEAPRMPDDPWPTRSFVGIDVPALALAAHEASAPIKVELALRALAGEIERS